LNQRSERGKKRAAEEAIIEEAMIEEAVIEANVIRMTLSRFLWIVGFAFLCALILAPLTLSGRDEPTVDELKGRVANASVRDRPPLCLRIAERQLETADRSYAAGQDAKSTAALVDVVAYSELSRDYAIQSHKHEKQCEIAIRKFARKLTDVKHTVPHEDQEQVQNTIDRLEHIRDDLLLAMFPKRSKQ
jgi:hypothetical protein